jgi:ATP-dependent DNA ligase
MLPVVPGAFHHFVGATKEALTTAKILLRGKAVVGVLLAQVEEGPRQRIKKLQLNEPILPMDALLVEKIPEGQGWLYEPKWDGFRCLVFRHRGKVFLQSKSGQPLARYFPELADAFLKLKPKRFLLDGEIATSIAKKFSFDDLLPCSSKLRSSVDLSSLTNRVPC